MQGMSLVNDVSKALSYVIKGRALCKSVILGRSVHSQLLSSLMS